ncbi:VOC family protein [Cohnella xylanilytica]|uniref:Bleomycin resistance protein n=1 Tax=Cohnella xylanilytica TaxID=557555 RepID=A0A841TWX1_9BACL|nr:glyoxalase superfamily protein [Cohnella xylanilytica]MBB6690451.1 VOC family protein [Cohnella xylanilytica]
MILKEIVPILRIFDVPKAREFYLDYLEFQEDWEHRFEEGFPLYIQISKGPIKLHLSEHYGDCSPGAAVRIEVEGIADLHQKLIEKQYSYSRPGLEKKPWGSQECCVTDPFGNRIIFYEYDEEEG